MLAPLKGDFDHDGRQDTAGLTRLASGRYGLQIARGADPRHPMTIQVLRPGETLRNIFLDTARGGRFQTACDKGCYGPETGRCSRDWITARDGDLTFGTEESSAAIVLWNGTDFDVEWTSD